MENKFIKTIWLLKHHVFRSVPGVLKFITLMLIAGILSTFYCHSQEPAKRTITGKVTFAEDNQPVPGANIIIKGTTTGTVTGVNGDFSIDVRSGDVLVISFLGYNDKEITVNEQTYLNISLVEEVTKLDEVVVIGYGQMKRSDLSSAQVSISSDEILKSNATTLEQVLQGRAAGVYVSTNSGQPGGSISVNIRGISSIANSTEPMYVIDGVQILAETGSSSNPLAGINPDDIESMQILQGPSATAIYGSRAANGVIVITTKRGSEGQVKISYSGMYSIQDMPELLPTMSLSEYAAYQNELADARGWERSAEYLDPSVFGEGTNWQKELFQRAPIQKHQISLSGGNVNTRYYLSAGYFNQEGIAIGSGFDRYSFRLNLDNTPRKWLKLGTNIMASQTNEVITVTNSENDLINVAISQSPAVAVRNPDGSWGGPSTTQFMISNPVALAQINDHSLRRIFGMGGIFAEINLIKGLKLRTDLNGNIYFGKKFDFEPGYEFSGYIKEQEQARSTRSLDNSTEWSLNTLLEYNTQIGKHNINVMASHEAREKLWESLSGARQGFITNTIEELNSGDITTSEAYSGKGDWAMESFFGRLYYIFDERYIIHGTLRADGSPNFGENKRWGYFPAISLAWRISKESFMQNVSQVDNLKLRLEYGVSGNQNSGSATYFATMRTGTTPWGTGYLPNNYSNPDFQWEETKAYNAGLDVNLFRNRIEFIADFYLRETDNLMMQIPLPAYLGTEGSGSVQAPWVNIGAMENRGFGITLNTVNIENPLKWESGFTFSLDKNKLTKLYTENSIIDRSPWFMGNFISRSEINEPVWQFYGYKADGLFLDTLEIRNHAVQSSTGLIDENQGTWVGDIKFINMNNDSIIDDEDRTNIGSPWPKFSFGFNNTFTYKNFVLYIAINGIYGNKIFNYVRYKNENPNGSGPGSGYLKAVADFARVSTDANGEPILLNPETKIPRVTSTDPNANNRPSDQFVEDGSFIRFKNIQLSYSIPEKVLSKIPINGIMVSASVQNAFTFTKY